jgi:succinate-acetate transporter protein
MLIPAAGASLGKVIAAVVLATTAVRFVVTGVYQCSGSEPWETAAGAVGLVLCALALYTATAMLLEDVRRRSLLPVWRRGRGRASIEGDFSAQLDAIEREAGVREQL